MPGITNDIKDRILGLAGNRAKADLGPVDEQELREHYRNINELKVGQTPAPTSSTDFPAEPEPSLADITGRIGEPDRIPANQNIESEALTNALKLIKEKYGRSNDGK